MELNVVIIGLGLIGGSLAKALRQKLHVKRITAIDPSAVDIDAALRDGSIDAGHKSMDFTNNDISFDILNSDLIFICTPVKTIFDYINKLQSLADTHRSPDTRRLPGALLPVITDTGSTKSAIMRHAAAAGYLGNCFIGGHPMTGNEKSGYGAGYAHLFENAYYILTPPPASPPAGTVKDGSIENDRGHDHAGLNLLKQVLEGIGAIPVVMDSCEHDRIMASISHVPHIIASALVNLVRSQQEQAGDTKAQMLAAGGFKDITRIASSSPGLWEGISISNAAMIDKTLAEYISILENFRIDLKQAQKEGDSISIDGGVRGIRGICSFFSSAKAFRDSIPSAGTGTIAPSCDISVDVVDKPGIIGEIATLLGGNNINIKNLSISNSREHENGCMRITLPDTHSVNLAVDLLVKCGYKVYIN